MYRQPFSRGGFMTGTAIETTVTDAVMATVAAWNANDADAFADLYTPDATVVLPGGTFLRGREEIRRYMTAGFAGPLRGTRGSDEQDSVRLVGDCAVVVSRSGYLLPGEDAPAPDRARRATWTLTRTEGRWLVEAYHNCPL
jgi:uncharacterized protein (TIGR02246 family)